MRHHRVLSILVVVAALLLGQAFVLGAAPIEDIPTAFVIDPCRAYVADPGDEIDDWDQTAELRMIDLSDSPPEEIDHRYSTDEFFGGVAFTSVPDYERKFMFATLGSKVVVYDVWHRLLGSSGVSTTNFMPVGSVDLGAEFNLPGLELGRIAAGDWFTIEVQPGVLMPQAALYIVGTRPDTEEAFYFVIEQESLLPPAAPPEGWTPVPVVYGQGQLCFYDNCTVSSVFDIRLGDLEGPGYVEEAYITTVQPFSISTDLQMTYRLERSITGSPFSSEVVHVSYFEAPQAGVDAPLVKEASGLRFAPDSHDAYVPRKDNWRIANLVSGAESCALPAEPTDVAVWQPASSSVRYLLVSTWDGLTGRLYVTPADGCVDPANPVAFDVVLGNQPNSLDVFNASGDEATVLVVGKGDEVVDEEFQSIQLTYTGTTDSFVASIEGISLKTLLKEGEVVTGELDSCPSYVHFGLRDLAIVHPPVCPNDPLPCDGNGIDRNCLPGDLRCKITPRP